MTTTFTNAQLPERATCWHDEATVLTGNALLVQGNTSQVYNTKVFQNPSANGDSFTSSVFLKAGTYIFSVLGITESDACLLDWYLDGVSLSTGQDWYSAPIVYNVVKTASVTISADGYHTLKGIVNGKNASSSNYFALLTKYWFEKGSD